MIGAGQRQRRIRVEQAQESKTPEGVMEDIAWTPVQNALARMFWGTGAERRKGAAEGSTQSATFNVQATAALRGVTEQSHRIVDRDGGESVWNIVAISEPNRREIEFTAVRARG